MNAAPWFRLHPGDGVVVASEGTVVVVAPGWRSVGEVRGLLGSMQAAFDDAAAAGLSAAGVAGVGWARRRDDGSVEVGRRGAVRLVTQDEAEAGAEGVTITRGPWLLVVEGAQSAAVEGTWLRDGLVVAAGVSGSGGLVDPSGVEEHGGAVPDRHLEPEPDLSPPTRAVPAIENASAAAPAATPGPFPPPARPAPARVAPAPAPAPAAPVTPAPPIARPGPPPPAAPGTFIDLRAPAPSRPPLPKVVVDDRAVQVRGIHCRNGHFNNPEGRLCYLCGDNMQNQSIAIGPGGEIGVLGIRPPIGILTLDDGSVYQLSDDLVLGRDPQPDGHLAAIVNDGSVSRNHLRIHLHGWEVLVEDLGSSNGSHLLPPGATTYHRLVPGKPAKIRSGTVLAFGQRWASFEATAAGG